MLQNYTTYRVLRLFFDQPTKGFQLREITRMLKLGMPSVKLHTDRLEKEEFVKREKKGTYASYKASGNEKFMLYKKTDMLLRLHESGLVEFLADEMSPNAIVLFGSASRGEDIERSDIDLLVIAKEKDIDLERFEKRLKRRINILFEPNLKNMPKELLNNILNGVVIHGYLEVFP